MALKSELMAGGMPATLASKLGFDPLTAYTAAGTTQATATLLTGNAANVTTALANAGVLIKRMNERNIIYNIGPNVLTIYPDVNGTIAGLAKNAGTQLAAGKTATFEGDGLILLPNISA
jgi:hypothetical protein